MQPTQLRQMVEQLGCSIAFIPDPPCEKFRQANALGYLQANAVGYLEVQGLSLSDDDGKSWVRGWEFSFNDESGALVDRRYLDESELEEVCAILHKWSDESIRLAYEYHSKDGVIFQKFGANQRITCLIPGVARRNGVDGADMVESVISFMESSAKLWE